MCLTTAWIYNGIEGLTAIAIRSLMTEAILAISAFLSAQIGDTLATKEVGKRNMGEWSWNLNTFLLIPAHTLYWINHSSLTAFRTITKARGIPLGPRPEELGNVENSTARSHGFAPVCPPTFPHNLNDAKLVCGLSQQMERHLRLSSVLTMPTRGPSPQDTD